MINLARAYSGQRRWLDTEILLNDLQDILMRKIEVREVDRLHPDRLVLMQEQSRNYANQGQVEKAQRLLTELIPMMDEKLGVEHPRTQSARKQLGQLQHHDEMPTASKKEVQKPLLDRPKAPTW